jgi:hypothetical protein
MKSGARVIVDIVQAGPNLLWIDTWDGQQTDMRTCAVYCEPGDERPDVGDSISWTEDQCLWTPANGSRSGVVLKKIGDAGAQHPNIPPADQRRRVKVAAYRQVTPSPQPLQRPT